MIEFSAYPMEEETKAEGTEDLEDQAVRIKDLLPLTPLMGNLPLYPLPMVKVKIEYTFHNPYNPYVMTEHPKTQIQGQININQLIIWRLQSLSSDCSDVWGHEIVLNANILPIQQLKANMKIFKLDREMVHIEEASDVIPS